MFDYNEVIIKDSNKIRFSSDVFIPNDVLIRFYSLVVVINYIIEKNDEFIPEIYIDEGYFEEVSYKMNKVRELRIDSTLRASPAKIINLLDFKPEKLSIKTENNANNNIKVDQVRYENGGFYLTIDNIKGYFNISNNISILDMIFSDNYQRNKYHQVWKEIFKVINDKNGELKMHEKMRLFDSNLPIENIIEIPSTTIVIN